MEKAYRKLGSILVERGVLSEKTVDRVVTMAIKMKKRVGLVLEEMGLVTEDELIEALAIQYGLKPIANIAKGTFTHDTLATMTAEVALENMFFPLRLEGHRLAVAIADPTYTKILDNLAANTGLTIVPFLSTKREIKAAICRHYLGKDCARTSRKTVLVAEDDVFLLELLKEVLSKQYRVLTAVDGLDAYKEVISKKPQVVLTDKEMPKLNGIGLLGALRAVPETKRIPVIMISGTDGEVAETEAFERGFFDYIAKPIKETTLLSRVKRAYQYSESQNYLFLK